MNHFSRREFLTSGGAYLSSQAIAPTSGGSVTVGLVLSRIREKIGIPWREKTVDNLLTGTPDTAVRGLETTMMATLDVVQTKYRARQKPDYYARNSVLSVPGPDGRETREWELVEYCQDSILSGNKKALIVVGHVLSEQGGMILCRDWLRGFVPEVPVDFIPAREPFWIAQHPRKV